MHISTDKKGSCLPNKCSAHLVVLRVDVPKEFHWLENIKPWAGVCFPPVSSAALERCSSMSLTG